MRFGLKESKECERCKNIETIKHLIYDCEYSQEIWRLIGGLKNENVSSLEEVFLINYENLEIIAEVILRLTNKTRPVIRPNLLLLGTVSYLERVEKGRRKKKLYQEWKTKLKALKYVES